LLVCLALFVISAASCKDREANSTVERGGFANTGGSATDLYNRAGPLDPTAGHECHRTKASVGDSTSRGCSAFLVPPLRSAQREAEG
jgi:hypothetical protein